MLKIIISPYFSVSNILQGISFCKLNNRFISVDEMDFQKFRNDTEGQIVLGI